MIYWYNIYVWLFQYIHNMDILKYQIRLANRSFCMKGLKLYDTIEHKYYALFFYLHTELLITWKCKIICYIWVSLLYLYNFISFFGLAEVTKPFLNCSCMNIFHCYFMFMMTCFELFIMTYNIYVSCWVGFMYLSSFVLWQFVFFVL